MITVITKDFELLNDIFKFMLARFKESKGMDKYIHIESMTIKPLNAGAAYIFNKDKGGSDNWGQVKKLIASDGADNDDFGISVSMSGNNVIVGAHFQDRKVQIRQLHIYSTRIREEAITGDR